MPLLTVVGVEQRAAAAAPSTELEFRQALIYRR